MKNSIYILSLALVVLFTACSNDDDSVRDTVAPTISIVEPHDHEEFEPGDEIHVVINFTDNIQLASYKIDIHYAGDGHTHGNAVNSSTMEWNFIQEGTLTGTSQTIEAHIEIPTTIDGLPIKEGDYDFGVFALDAAGNQTVIWIEIEIGAH